MNTQKTADKAVAEVMAAKPDNEVRVCRRIEVGSNLHQGDVYIHKVEDSHPRGSKTGTRQVAVGNTVGARHIAVGKLEVFAGSILPAYMTPAQDVPVEAYLGPVVVADEDWTLEHPEHANHRLPAGTYQVTYQVDPVEQRRVLD